MGAMRILQRVACLLVSALAAAGALPRQAAEPTPSTPDQARLEAEFARRMTGATLRGRFTVDQAPDAAPQEEIYRLGAVEKLGGERWRFDAGIEYGGKSYSLPLILDVKWAGDTPVITLTDLSIPMLGTFTARVVVYGERYAGIWDGGDHGGQMFGRLIPADAEQPAAAGEEANDDSDR
jgi:hypothetical protein